MKRIIIPVILISMLSFVGGCKKKDTVTMPTLTTTAVTGIALTSATSGGNISSDGNSAVTARGVCWSTSADPTTSDSKTSDGTGTGQYSSNITGINPGTLYNVRAYATNSAGTAYGDQVTFTTTASQLATLTTTAISSITAITAASGGTITDDGGSGITARGVCWSTSSGPTISGPHSSDGSGKGTFTSSLTGLTASTMYYVRAYATNGSGTAYGDEFSFTTLSAGGATDVTIQSFAFSPPSLTVSVNATVKWTNNDAVTHTVTSDVAGVFNSGNLTPGSSFSFQFTSPGTFNYHCSIHPGMLATIIVQ
jgi:plastocyanin